MTFSKNITSIDSQQLHVINFTEGLQQEIVYIKAVWWYGYREGKVLISEETFQ